jgi:nucleoside diphosphate kinase
MAESTTERLFCALYEPSYFSESRWAVPLLEQLAGELPHRLLRELKRSAFALVKPDAVVSGRAGMVIAHLRAQGLEPIEAWPLMNPKLRQFEELYKFNLTLQNEQNQVSSWWLNGQVYCMAPSLLLMVVSTHEPDSVHQRLALGKGPSTPHRGRGGQLRYDLRACNKTLNLIHCADDPLSTAREYLIYRKMADLHAVLHRRAAMKDSLVQEVRTAVDRQVLALARSLGTPLHRIDLFDTVIRVISLTVHALCAVSPGLWRPRTWARLQEDIAELSCAVFADGTPHESATRFIKACRALQVRTRNVSASGGVTAALLVQLQRLVHPQQLDDVAVEQCLALLEHCAMPLSSWDKLVLRSSVHYPEDLRDLFVGA